MEVENVNPLALAVAWWDQTPIIWVFVENISSLMLATTVEVI